MKKSLTSALSAIAALAIALYVFGLGCAPSSQWLALLLTSLIIGITTFALPLLIEKFNFAYSLICTGFTVLLMTPFAKLNINSEQKYWCIFLLITDIALVTDSIISMINKNFSFYNIVFDIGICFLANFIISKFNNGIITLLILLIAYAIILLVNFSFDFSLKRKKCTEKSEDTKIPVNQSNVENPTNINVPMGKRSIIDIPVE